MDDLPGKQWIPSNGTEGGEFLSTNCPHCAHDRAMREGADLDDCDDDEKCEIIAASFRGEAVEWRELPDETLKCMAFVPAGEQIPTPRCERTADMFGEPKE